MDAGSKKEGWVGLEMRDWDGADYKNGERIRRRSYNGSQLEDLVVILM